MRSWKGPWDVEAAAHLLRRIAFAPRPGEIEAVRAAGIAAAVQDRLGGSDPAPQPEADVIQAAVAASPEASDHAGALLLRLATTTEPLREHLVLLFHNHFVSALSKVRDGRLMEQQLALFRRLGPGSFEDLALAVGRDPAMVRYLDSERSTRDAPNENYARELMELFTMGPGPYDERDVEEAARAFTGYHLRHGRFHLSRASHDDGTKCVLGQRGRFDGEAVTRLCVNHPATASFMARKLARAFVCDAPAPAVIAAIAASWRRHEGHTGAVLAELFRSEIFFAPEHRHALTRSPAQLVAAVLRALELRRAPKVLARATLAMGQALYDPPTVKGYPGGADWLNPATWLARRAFLIEAAQEAEASDIPELGAAVTPAEQVVAWARHLLGAAPVPALTRKVAEIVAREPQDQRTRALIAVLCHPRFQRC